MKYSPVVLKYRLAAGKDSLYGAFPQNRRFWPEIHISLT